MPPVKVYGAKPQAEPSRMSPVLAGMLAGIAAAVLWTVMSYVTHRELGFVALGVGVLVGAAVGKSASDRGRSLGTTAALLTVIAFIIAKLLTYAFALVPVIQQESLKNEKVVTWAFLNEMLAQRSFSPELQNELGGVTAMDSVPMPLRRRLLAEATAQAVAARPAERERVVDRQMTKLVSQLGFLLAASMEFSMGGLVWFALGIAAAWKLAQPKSG